jgi:hypothetical protein
VLREFATVMLIGIVIGTYSSIYVAVPITMLLEDHKEQILAFVGVDLLYYLNHRALHAVAWPIGPTHASGLRLLCRKHHLLKTFWTGERGWTDQQFPDGTIRWTSPTGRVYITIPGSRMLFPGWDTRTAPVPPGPPTDASPDRAQRMPLRRRTRAAEQVSRVKRERALNDARVAERNRPPPF